MFQSGDKKSIIPYYTNHPKQVEIRKILHKNVTNWTFSIWGLHGVTICKYIVYTYLYLAIYIYISYVYIYITIIIIYIYIHTQQLSPAPVFPGHNSRAKRPRICGRLEDIGVLPG